MRAGAERIKVLARASSTLLILVLAGAASTAGQQNRLVGDWECYRQGDRAKIQSCLYSIEFLPDGTVIQKQFSEAEVEVRGTYSVKGDHIIVKFEGGASWRYTFRLLKNGDLFLSKAPWNWNGWLTRDSTRVPENHGCGWLRTRDKE